MRRLLLVLTIALVFAPAAGAWTWPADGPVLQPFSFDRTQPYAAGQHRGLDIGGDPGASVLAPAAGVVTFAGSVPTSGKSITIETADGYDVTLTHLGSITVQKGATVAEGDGVGTIGPSGDPEVSEPYVHLGIRLDADEQGYLDPAGFLPARTPESTAPVSPAADDPLPPLVVAAGGAATPSVPPAPLTPPTAAPDPAVVTPAAAATPAAQVPPAPVASAPAPVAALAIHAIVSAPRVHSATPATPSATRNTTRQKPARVVVRAAPVVRARPSTLVSVSQSQPQPAPAAPPASAQIAVSHPHVSRTAVISPVTFVTAIGGQNHSVISYRTSVVRRGHAHALLGGALAVSGALAFLAALGLGRRGAGLTRTGAPIMEGDALLRDHPDLLRELDAAHRSRLHDLRRRHPRPAPAAAGRRDVLPDRRRRARDEGVPRRGGARPRTAGVRRSDRRLVAGLADEAER
jgi:hypothetical protein